MNRRTLFATLCGGLIASLGIFARKSNAAAAAGEEPSIETIARHLAKIDLAWHREHGHETGITPDTMCQTIECTIGNIGGRCPDCPGPCQRPQIVGSEPFWTVYVDKARQMLS